MGEESEEARIEVKGEGDLWGRKKKWGLKKKDFSHCNNAVGVT